MNEPEGNPKKLDLGSDTGGSDEGSIIDEKPPLLDSGEAQLLQTSEEEEEVEFKESQVGCAVAFPPLTDIPDGLDEGELFQHLHDSYHSSEAIKALSAITPGQLAFLDEKIPPIEENDGGETNLSNVLKMNADINKLVPKKVTLETDLQVHWKGSKRENVIIHGLQRAAAPVKRIKRIPEEMTQTQGLAIYYLLCFLCSILFTLGCLYGIVALLVNPPAFLSEMP